MGLLEKMERQRSQQKESSGEELKQTGKRGESIHNYENLKDTIHQKVIDQINKENIMVSGRELTAELFGILETIVDNEAGEISILERSKISEAILDDIVGYGPIEPLLRDDSISEIMVNGPKKVYIESGGTLKLSNVAFRDDEHVMNVIDRIVSSVGRHIDESSPMVDARLPDGSRVNAIIPPLSLSGPVITIRKFSKTPIHTEQLLEFGSLSKEMVAFLDACVKGKLNIIVSGGTGSGKTTLLNVLSSFIPHNERILTIEDVAELQLLQDHVITLESRPANLEDKGQISIRQLVVNALRMRPDRIIVGEVRSAETLDMLQAMNTGHDGSLTTIHANSARDSLSRIETMILMAGVDLPLRAIREQISSAIDLVVQQSRLRDGTRKIVTISEVTGMDSDTIIMQDIFKFETTGEMDSRGKLKGRFVSSGVRPQCLEKIIGRGIKISNDWFIDH